MNKKILFALIILLSTSCVRAADAEDAKIKKLTTESFKRSLFDIAQSSIREGNTDLEKQIVAEWSLVNAFQRINQEEFNQLLIKFEELNEKIVDQWQRS